MSGDERTRRRETGRAAIVACAAIALVVLGGCEPTEHLEGLTAGEVAGRTYTNAYLGFAIDLPEGWAVLDEGAVAMMRERGEQAIARDNLALQAAQTRSGRLTMRLLSAAPEQAKDGGAGAGDAGDAGGRGDGGGDEADAFRPSLHITAERIDHRGEIETSDDYLARVMQALSMTRVELDAPSEFAAMQRGGIAGHRAEVAITRQRVTTSQRYFCFVRREYAVTCVATWRSEADRAAIESAMKTLRATGEGAAARGAIERDRVRVIHDSEPFPTVCLGSGYNLKPELAAKLREAMIRFEFQGTGLANEYAGTGDDRFVEVSYKDDWALIRRIDDAVGFAHEVTEEPAVANESD